MYIVALFEQHVCVFIILNTLQPCSFLKIKETSVHYYKLKESHDGSSLVYFECYQDFYTKLN